MNLQHIVFFSFLGTELVYERILIVNNLAVCKNTECMMNLPLPPHPFPFPYPKAMTNSSLLCNLPAPFLCK